eukprot:8864428-Alexandrium_andersonii.AAC.1
MATEEASGVAGLPAGADAVLDSAAIKRAACARAKYRSQDSGGVVAIPPLRAGVHPRNRNGVGVNGSRCGSLFKSVLGSFEYSEACPDAVCIEEEPG